MTFRQNLTRALSATTEPVWTSALIAAGWFAAGVMVFIAGGVIL